MRKVVFLSIILILLVAVFIFYRNYNQNEFIKSADGHLVIEGKKDDTLGITIGEYPIFSVDNFSLTAYEVASDNELQHTVELYFDERDREDIADWVIFELNPIFDMWQETESQEKEGIISLESDHLGWFTLGKRQEIVLPDLSSDLADILETAPEKTISFNVALAYFNDQTHETIITESLFSGGCGGVFEEGTDIDLGRLEKMETIQINGQSTNVALVYLPQWVLAEGCKVGENLEQGF